MGRLVDIDDEKFWDVLFNEACVEGKQAERIQIELNKIVNESVKGDLISRSFVLSVIKHFQNMQSWNEEAKFSEILRKIEEEQPTVGNDGWIPVSSGNPKETGLYQVTVDDNDEPVITAMYLAEVDTWSYHAGYGNYMKVLAWRELPQPYKENEK